MLLTGKLWTVLLLGLLLSACEWFSTASIEPRPEGLNQYQDIFRDSLEYKMEESLRRGEEPIMDSVISRKKIAFYHIKDSLSAGQEMSYIRMRVFNWKTGEVEAENHFLVRLEESAIQYAPTGTRTGPKLFLLKTGADTSEPAGFFHLLSLLSAASKWSDNRGGFIFSRNISGLDTLEYHRQLEETWVVNEEVTHGSQTLMQGVYWYGKSGLLQSRQTWQNLNFWSAEGQAQGNLRVLRTFSLL